MPPETEAARLYDTIGASLFRHALMILANREAAEDVIQQVFLALLDGRAGRPHRRRGAVPAPISSLH